ncbi:RbsD/FucU family protein [Spelaeicoccus albus]|uniref:L-fucose mutarotase n=1 Tax=Spelaeicoccus albus TaxID=1280376 RepID=A0A7Z0A955_9MICO|nr:RbsD/FucU domain-containing protein [Spelaeicoccus albus]NYI66697.1 L-fucose mutarotase [Spelaeicoccus albus]
MLTGIHPLLTGRLLWCLDRLGHSDSVVIADAHFPAARIAAENAGTVLDFPAVGSPDMLAAVRTVIPLDDAPALDLMASASGDVLVVQQELMRVAGVDAEHVRFTDRFDFYETAAGSSVIVRTGETRQYGNVLLRKGLVDPAGDSAPPLREGTAS